MFHSPSRRALLGSTAIPPVASVDFTLGVLPSWVTFSRTGNAMQYDSTGKLTWGPVNEYINSSSPTNTARTITTVAGVSYYIWIQTSSGSATIVASGTNSSTFNGSAGGTATTFTATAGTLTLTPTSNYANITAVVVGRYTYESSFPRPQDSVVTGASAYYGPRFDYNPNTLAAKGLLIEEARTNLVTYSQDFSNAAWTKSGTITSAGTNPAGVTGQLFTPNAGSSQKLIHQTVTVTTATSYAVSYFVQPNGYSKVALRESAATGAYAAFNLTGSGSVLDSGSGGTGSIVKLANGWYRITMVSTSSGTSFRPDLWVLDPTYTTGSVIGSWTADGTSGVYVFGAQLEAGASSTSYIPITSASVTRAAETVTFTGPALTAFQGAAFSAVLELNGSQGVINGTTSILTTNASQYPIYVSTNTAGSTYNGSVALQTTIGGSGTFTGTIPMRIVIAGDAGGRSFVANNGTLTTDANKMFPTAVTNAYLGSLAGSYQFNGWFGKVALYNARLPDVTLKSKSVAGAPFW